ncbi:MAG: DUF3127 domain-containing protein [Planctomycetota bacterium]
MAIRRGDVHVISGRSLAAPIPDKSRHPTTAQSRKMQDGKVKGKVHFVDETRTYGQKNFRKRLVVLEQENERFTNYVPVEFVRDDCDSADAIKEGDTVEIAFRLNGRRWQRDPDSDVKYFLNAEAISFEVLSAGGSGGGDGDANDAFDDAADGEYQPPF